MGKAVIEIETYNDGAGVRFNYVPKGIPSYTIVGVLRRIIKHVEESGEKAEKGLEWKHD